MAPEASGFDYAPWTQLLSAVVSAQGKVDYEALAERRDMLAGVVGQLAAASPDSHPVRFEGEGAALAYWINAYNALVLDAVMDEYPIRSVFKTRDGQFFQRERHVAGGTPISLDDIEHRILRGRFTEPRIHFAINCASGGCPPMRPKAYEPGELDKTLADATRHFLASEWNCRIDRDAGKIFVSRLFKMYAEDFAGDTESTGEYRHGVLQFVAEHTGEDLAGLEDLELVYNTYDWGLNDSNRDPRLRPITFHESVETFHDGDTELRELLLYDGNFCNRDCSWCTVFGSPEGWHREYSEQVLDEAARQVARDGNIKFYGGEPTLHTEGLLWAMQYLRARGFEGLFSIYSNGIRASHLIRVLESDEKTEAVLNYSIYMGRDAEPLSDHAKESLEAWSREHPMRVFSGYKVLYESGAGAAEDFDRDRQSDYHGHGTGCLLCFPVLRSTGEFRACPFAVENDAPHFRLGERGRDPKAVFSNYRAFRRWAVDVLDPAAEARGVSSCAFCERHVVELPLPDLA
ncbi:MAG: DUF547 domain-containing protein [Candidatus Binatia bacterium]|nr:DUF547 domain-containing protein [Candidatus Binatia bacterium]